MASFPIPTSRFDPKAPADFTLPRYDVVHEGSDVAILALGSFFSLGESLCATRFPLLRTAGLRSMRPW